MKFVLVLASMLFTGLAAASPQASQLVTKQISGTSIAYQIIQPGSGPRPKVGQNVTVKYQLWRCIRLENCRFSDQSIWKEVPQPNKPFTFMLGKGQVISGWDMMVAEMSKGSTVKVIIPPKYAYGNRELPGIPANSTLMFTINLLSSS